MFLKIFMVVFISLYTNFVLASSESGRNMAIAVSPIQALLPAINLLYQYKINSSMAITMPINFTYNTWIPKAINKFTQDSKSTGKDNYLMMAAFGLGTKFFMSKHKSSSLNDSFYLEPRLVYSHKKLNVEHDSTKYYKSKVNTLDALFIMGKDWVYESGLFVNLDGGLGLQYFMSNETQNTFAADGLDNILAESDTKFSYAASFDFKIGYAF